MGLPYVYVSKKNLAGFNSAVAKADRQTAMVGMVGIEISNLS